MAGIYIHIPFCKQACSYCNFHFSTSASHRKEILNGILKEINQRADFFKDQPISSIYFGGGTPSILDQSELSQIFDQLEAKFELSQLKEVTLEANPDDLSQRKLKELKDTPINRLSIGIQSLHQKDLRLMNRAHNAEEGINSVKRALEFGFEKLSLDLIFGVPNSSLSDWEYNLEKVFELEFDHLSAYALTMEEGTLFHHQVQNGEIKELEDHSVAEQYQLLQQYIQDYGWEQYELSNYCRNDQIAIHNTAYWLNEKYLGIGPSAHSYDGSTRRWNIANNHLYYKQMIAGKDYFETEQLSEADRYHELLISRLRTKWGISWQHIDDHFSPSIGSHFKTSVQKLKHLLHVEEDAVSIKKAFWLTSDQVLREMMISS
jgi:oxygen-independent coproporphyrinogen-3 oxidase